MKGFLFYIHFDICTVLLRRGRGIDPQQGGRTATRLLLSYAHRLLRRPRRGRGRGRRRRRRARRRPPCRRCRARRASRRTPPTSRPPRASAGRAAMSRLCRRRYRRWGLEAARWAAAHFRRRRPCRRRHRPDSRHWRPVCWRGSAGSALLAHRPRHGPHRGAARRAAPVASAAAQTRAPPPLMRARAQGRCRRRGARRPT
mmetsp:Transcript_11623/g.48876  ORF Transcript_11623/g.48876 Transcript_11623/m.48876 type:complete len:200 (-) Transcript_11623:1575-2174(-)